VLPDFATPSNLNAVNLNTAQQYTSSSDFSAQELFQTYDPLIFFNGFRDNLNLTLSRNLATLVICWKEDFVLLALVYEIANIESFCFRCALVDSFDHHLYLPQF